MSPDQRECLARLEGWARQIDELAAMVQDRRPLAGAPAAAAREALTVLKADLAAEVKRLAGLERRGELNAAQRSSYEPHIQQTAAELTVRVNSTPDGKWFSELYHAAGTISHAIADLKRPDA